MKLYCAVDGIHFVQDFEKTLQPPCNFWGDWGMTNVPVELKRKFWDWVYQMPTDEIALTCKLAISIGFSAHVFEEQDEFKNKIEGYESMSEEEQQQAQRAFFKKAQRGTKSDILKRKPKERIIN